MSINLINLYERAKEEASSQEFNMKKLNFEKFLVEFEGILKKYIEQIELFGNVQVRVIKNKKDLNCATIEVYQAIEIPNDYYNEDFFESEEHAYEKLVSYFGLKRIHEQKAPIETILVENGEYLLLPGIFLQLIKEYKACSFNEETNRDGHTMYIFQKK